MNQSTSPARTLRDASASRAAVPGEPVEGRAQVGADRLDLVVERPELGDHGGVVAGVGVVVDDRLPGHVPQLPRRADRQEVLVDRQEALVGGLDGAALARGGELVVEQLGVGRPARRA